MTKLPVACLYMFCFSFLYNDIGNFRIIFIRFNDYPIIEISEKSSVAFEEKT